MSFRSMAWSTISKALDRSSATRTDLFCNEGANFTECGCCAVTCSEPMLVFVKGNVIFEERENRRLEDFHYRREECDRSIGATLVGRFTWFWYGNNFSLLQVFRGTVGIC